MNAIAKSLMTLAIGLALSSAVSAQTAPSPSPMPKPAPSMPAHDQAKVDAHAKHKAPAVPSEKTPVMQRESSKVMQPLAAGKQVPATTKETKESSAVQQPSKVKHEKSLSSATPAVKPEAPAPTAKPVK